MHTFQVMETFTAAPSNLISGISDLELVMHAGELRLYTATRAGGGVVAFDIDAGMTVVDQELTAPGSTLPAAARLEVMSVNGAAHLVVTGGNTGGVQAHALGADGALTGMLQLPGSLTGALSAQSVVQSGGQTYFYAARMGESAIHAYVVGANGAMTLVGTRVIDTPRSGVDIPSLTTVRVGGVDYLVSLSLNSDAVSAFPIGPGGVLGTPKVMGMSQGLGIANPSAVEVVVAGG